MTAKQPAQAPLALLTGGNGFVGSRVARRLVSLGWRVRAIVRKKGIAPELNTPLVEEIEGDLVSRYLVSPAAAGCDAVIHCAAGAGPDLEPVRRINVDGTRTMSEVALAARAKRYVHISTIGVYDIAGAPVVTEDTPLKTQGDPYGLTKAEADRVVLDAMVRGLPATILRPGAILGVHPTSTWAVKIPGMVRDRKIKLKDDGGDSWPFVHVENLVDAILLSIESDRAVGRVYNMVDEHRTWREYTDEIRAWFESEPLDSIPRAELPLNGYWTGRIDASRIRSELGYAPKLTYEDGMAEAATYWKSREATPAP
jgi:nucleoside-diphosphate-sugar epimerase